MKQGGLIGTSASLNEIKMAVSRRALYPVFKPYIQMPGQSFSGKLPPLTKEEEHLAKSLRGHVDVFADKIGVRHMAVAGSLQASAGYIARQFEGAGYTPAFLPFWFKGVSMHNVVAEIPGREHPQEVLLYFAHYDTTFGTKGADDNASALATLIELARLLRNSQPACTVRFVAVANEEHTGEAWENMGSYHYSRGCSLRNEKVRGIALEMLGYFSDQPGSQKYPYPFNLFYPDKGNFIAFIGNKKSRDFVREVIGLFREEVLFPSEGGAIPDRFADINRSDHWSLWQFGYQGLMMTDTSNFRNPHLHKMSDTPDTLNYDFMARLTSGMARVTCRLTA